MFTTLKSLVHQVETKLLYLWQLQSTESILWGEHGESGITHTDYLSCRELQCSLNSDSNLVLTAISDQVVEKSVLSSMTKQTYFLCNVILFILNPAKSQKYSLLILCGYSDQNLWEHDMWHHMLKGRVSCTISSKSSRHTNKVWVTKRTESNKSPLQYMLGFLEQKLNTWKQCLLVYFNYVWKSKLEKTLSGCKFFTGRRIFFIYTAYGTSTTRYSCNRALNQFISSPGLATLYPPPFIPFVLWSTWNFLNEYFLLWLRLRRDCNS